jgi:hypothetical protein
MQWITVEPFKSRYIYVHTAGPPEQLKEKPAPAINLPQPPYYECINEVSPVCFYVFEFEALYYNKTEDYTKIGLK